MVRGMLTSEQRLLLLQLDDEWVYFDQIRSPFSRRRTAQLLRGLSRRRWVITRRNDVPGQGRRTEYAISEEGDLLLHLS